MQLTGIPGKFSVPFANSAGAGYIRPIPLASQIGHQNGAASLTDGFPPNCFVPIAGGGSWPFGQDFNGILNLITKWQQWSQAGGPISYDATFQAAIGGYPRGALVQSAATPGVLWQSNTDNNTTNPDTGGAGWTVLTLVDPNTGGLIISGSGAQGAGLQLRGNGATTPSKWIRATNGTLQVINSGYTAAILQLTDAGDLSSLRNVNASGAIYGGTGVSSGGDVSAGGNVSGAVIYATNVVQANNGIYPTQSNSREWVLTDSGGDHIQQYRASWYDRWETATGTRRWASPAGYVMSLDGSGNLTAIGNITGGNVTANGNVLAGNQLQANGSMSPTASAGREWVFYDSGSDHIQQFRSGWYNRWFSSNGSRQWVGNGAQIMQLDGVGNLTVAAQGNFGGTVGANGNVTANNGRLRASYGALNSGDPNAAALLLDFPASLGGAAGYQYLPSGMIIQWGYQFLNGDGNIGEGFPIAFPNICRSVVCCEGATLGGWANGNTNPTIHGVAGFNNYQWQHAGTEWIGSSWQIANLTTVWIAIGF